MKGEGTGVSGGSVTTQGHGPSSSGMGIEWRSGYGGIRGRFGMGKQVFLLVWGMAERWGEGVCRPWQELRGINPE